MRNIARFENIFSASGADGAGHAALVESFRDLVLALDTADDANMTIKFQGSISEVEPNWGAAQSVTNQWDYVLVVDLEDGSKIEGDTGIAFAGTDDHRQFEVNVNGLRWFNAIISSYVAGSATLRSLGMDNQ